MHNRVCVAVAHFKILLQVCHLLHVSQLGNLLQLFHPMRDWFAVFLLDGRKIRGGSSYFLLSHPNILQKPTIHLKYMNSPFILSNTRFILKLLSFYTYKGYRPNVPTQIDPVQASIVAISDTSAIYWPSLGDRQCLKIQ